MLHNVDKRRVKADLTPQERINYDINFCIYTPTFICFSHLFSLSPGLLVLEYNYSRATFGDYNSFLSNLPIAPF